MRMAIIQTGAKDSAVTVEPLDLRVIVHDDYLTDCNNFSQLGLIEK